ncbi:MULTISPECIES: PqqD family protein [unclassified Francisella]|uniref:PqqD family protein n=1 Tax=unclassified Francisella TaxID=2610885 RepID=UPI002E2FE12E|nr:MULTISPECIES: PqqD family protein [unclassified Francisella]MED7820168.1 PqqD family protein [Francisella sp. 19S2-4]MED7830984.1 PqqD family protein [Francisella sp. 19S2-10]
MSSVNQLQLNESGIIFHPSMGNSYQVNEVAKKMIALLQKNKTTQEIIEDLSKEYDIAEQELYIDVSDFISKLKIYNLI